MAVWLGLAVFIFGLIVGSFLNVVIYRHQTGRGVVRGRSLCLACGKTLEWHELLPLLSWLIQRGRCASCGSRISIQYPLVELSAGLLFLGVFWRLGFWQPAGVSFNFQNWLGLLIVWAMFSLLLAIAVYDLRHKIIPDPWVYAFNILAGLNLLLTRASTIWLSYGLTALGLFAFFAGLWHFSRGRWMGFGDAKLAVGIGLMLGPRLGVSAVIFGFWLGAAVGLGIILFARLLGGGGSFTIKNEIPFAPFLAAGVVASFLFNFNVIFL